MIEASSHFLVKHMVFEISNHSYVNIDIVEETCTERVVMVSVVTHNNGLMKTFDTNKSLDVHNTRMSNFTPPEFQHNSDSAFKALKAATKDTCTNESGMSTSSGYPINNTDHVNGATQHVHRDSDFCSQCFDSAASQIHDNLLHSMRPYEMSSQNIPNINNMNTGNFMRSAGLATNPWSFIESTSPNIQPHDIRAHHNIGNFGLKFHNSLMQFDNLSNLSNIQNIASIANNYSSLSSIYSPIGQGQLNTQVVPSRFDHGVTGPAFSWPSTRGAGFLTPRCPGK
ncbi:hypothetical protein ACF0H5_009125 [Mactra antiquata]